VDARDILEYRTVTLNLQNSNTSDPSYARSLQGHEPCYPTPGTSAINDGLIATSAAANWQILSQNAGDDGLLDLLSDLTDNWRPPPYAFNNSLNALEDALGLISALVASRINSSTTAASNGTAVITATTAGSRKPFAFAFIFPPVAAAIILFYLIVKTRAIKGELLRSSKLKDLIKVGQALGPDVELEEPEDGLLGSAAAHGQSSATELNGQPDDLSLPPAQPRDGLSLPAAAHHQSPATEPDGQRDGPSLSPAQQRDGLSFSPAAHHQSSATEPDGQRDGPSLSPAAYDQSPSMELDQQRDGLSTAAPGQSPCKVGVSHG
jgi:hypothetical protein